MQFDFRNLSAGELAVLAILGSAVVAFINGVSAFVTAWVNSRSQRRLEYLKVVRVAKIREARVIRRILSRRIKYYLALRAGKKPVDLPDTAMDESTFLPLFMASDSWAQKLNILANQHKAIVTQLIATGPDVVAKDTKEAINRIVRILILMSFIVEAAVLRDSSDPAKYLWRLHLDARSFLRGNFED